MSITRTREPIRPGFTPSKDVICSAQSWVKLYLYEYQTKICSQIYYCVYKLHEEYLHL